MSNMWGKNILSEIIFHEHSCQNKWSETNVLTLCLSTFLYRSNLATELWLRVAQSVMFRCSERERERQREDSTKRAQRHRGEKSGTTQDSETPTTRDSPFYCIHHHFIFLLLSICFISSWVLLQINSLLLRHFTPSAQRKKKSKRGVFLFSRFATLFHQIHSIRPQPNTFTVGSFFKGRLKWQAQRHSLLTLANKSYFFVF